MLATLMSYQQYRLIVEGELGPRYASAFEGMAISAHDGITEITGPVIDPSHLYGLLDRITGLGLTLQSLTPLDAPDAETTVHKPNATRSDRS